MFAAFYHLCTALSRIKGFQTFHYRSCFGCRFFAAIPLRPLLKVHLVGFSLHPQDKALPHLFSKGSRWIVLFLILYALFSVCSIIPHLLSPSASGPVYFLHFFHFDTVCNCFFICCSFSGIRLPIPLSPSPNHSLLPSGSLAHIITT